MGNRRPVRKRSSSGCDAAVLDGRRDDRFGQRESAVFAELPHKFEAGTVNGGGAVGLQAAIDYLMNVGFDEVQKREELLTTRAMTAMRQIPGVISREAISRKSTTELSALPWTAYIRTISRRF